MNRRRIERRTPLRPGKARLERRTRLPPINRERRARLVEQQFGPPERRAWIAAQPCDTCGWSAPSENSHVRRSRGAGGGPDDVAPQCASDPSTGREGCHDKLGRLGRATFERTMGVDLDEVADRYASAWRARPPIV